MIDEPERTLMLGCESYEEDKLMMARVLLHS